MNTYLPTAASTQQKSWYVVNAAGRILGRLATKVATILMGKHKATYVPHLDVGDFVVVVNAEKIKVTGRKIDQKLYYRHSGYPGGLKKRTFEEQLQRDPTKIIKMAVQNMLPKNKLGRKRLTKLKVYAGEIHPHESQMPQAMEVGGKW